MAIATKLATRSQNTSTPQPGLSNSRTRAQFHGWNGPALTAPAANDKAVLEYDPYGLMRNAAAPLVGNGVPSVIAQKIHHGASTKALATVAGTNERGRPRHSWTRVRSATSANASIRASTANPPRTPTVVHRPVLGRSLAQIHPATSVISKNIASDVSRPPSDMAIAIGDIAHIAAATMAATGPATRKATQAR